MEQWQQFEHNSPARLAPHLVPLARGVDLEALRRNPPGSKKPVTPRTRYPKHTHVSVAKLLTQATGKVLKGLGRRGSWPRSGAGSPGRSARRLRACFLASPFVLLACGGPTSGDSDVDAGDAHDAPSRDVCIPPDGPPPPAVCGDHLLGVDEECDESSSRYVPCWDRGWPPGYQLCVDCRRDGPCVWPEETCNGVDDDGSGTCDDGFECCAGAVEPCADPPGACSRRICLSSCRWSPCMVPTPTSELCNGRDEDCDGRTDEELWCPVQPGVLDDSFGAVWAVTQDDAWAVGSGVARWDGDSWSRGCTGAGVYLADVWAAGGNDYWAVGMSGTIVHWDGSSWSVAESGTTADLTAVWGAAADDLWAVGGDGTVLRGDGTSWTAMAPPVPDDLTGVWGSAATDVWVSTAVSDSSRAVLHWDGASWSDAGIPGAGGAHLNLRDIWGFSASDVWAVGFLNVALHWDGSAWTSRSLGASWPYGTEYFDVWGAASDDMWVVGRYREPGERRIAVRHWYGSVWNDGRILGDDYDAVGGSATGDVWLVGQQGRITHWNGGEWAKSAWPVLGSFEDLHGASSEDVWAVGPGSIGHWDGRSWTQPFLPGPWRLRGVWTMGANDAWAVGGLTFHQGWLVVHWDGSLWEVAATGPCPWFLNDAWGTAENDVWAVGDEGAILHWDGTRWSPVASGVSANLQKVCGVAPDDIWATGDGGAAIHWDGERWSDESGGIGFELLDLWGSGPADVWATARDPDGTGSVMVHWDGAEWTAAGPPDPYVSLICGLAPDDVWALGSRLSHWDGAGWREEPPCPAVSHPHSLWCAPGGDLWVTGSWATASDAVARWRP